MKLLVYLVILNSYLLSQCKEITLSSNGNLSSLEILKELSQECQISVIYLDSQTPLLLQESKPHLKVSKLKLRAFLDLLFANDDLSFQLKDSILSVGFLQTKTYEMNYISTVRSSSSSTNVILSQNPSNFDSPLQVSDEGKSGTKILSVDENHFWKQIQEEIQAIAYRPEDKYQPQSPQITINKNAGLLSITASKTQHNRIAQYIKMLENKLHAQVLIDVQIYIVRHQNNQTAGINWNELYNLGNLSILPPSSNAPSFIQLQNSQVHFGINLFSQGVSVNRILEFLKKYGQTRSISNPKILTLNNQPAIISVGSILRYTQNSIYQSTNASSNIQNTTQSYPSIFAGVLLDITPSIQGEDIILKINPSITRTKNAEIQNQSNALSSPPNLSTHQLSSIVRLKNGEKVVLGGLISNHHDKEEHKVPLLGDIPLLKFLFSYTQDNQYTEEMVILISPTIIKNSNLSPKELTKRFESLIQEAKALENQHNPHLAPTEAYNAN